jgi:hypothetical protein
MESVTPNLASEQVIPTRGTPACAPPDGAADTAFAVATSYLQAGLSVVPVRRDGSKVPEVGWKRYQAVPPTERELEEWFARADPPGIGVVCGAVSGGLEVIDFDDRAEDVCPRWRDLVEAERPGLAGRLSLVRTPSGGFHVRYRCTEVVIPGSRKLAREPGAENGKPRVLIETRGEGGYALAPGSPGECHETGGTYEHVAGPPPTEPATISAEDREVLLRCARAFDRECVQETGPPPARHGQRRDAAGLRPGDDFDARGPDWAAILGPHGWVQVRQDGEVRYWRRPGKGGAGWSATTGYCRGKDGADLLMVFSSNTGPFEPDRAYGKFRAYALLNHKGDHGAAARELAVQGFGEPPQAGGGGPSPRASGGEEGLPECRLGPLVLRPGRARQTASGKVTLQINAYRGGALAYPAQVSTAESSKRGPARKLAALAGASVEEVETALERMLAAAVERLAEPATPEGPTLQEVLARAVPASLGLTHRTERGLWSEKYAREVTRHEFVTDTPTGLLDACGLAVDLPRDGTGGLSRQNLVRAVQTELGVLWSDLKAKLPAPADGGPGAETEAGRRVRQQLITLWTKPHMFEVQQAADSGREIACRASLASRARRQARPYAEGTCPAEGRERWRPVHEAYAAWWRPYVSKEGEVGVALAMRFELTTQLGVAVSGATDQASLGRLGERLGCLASDAWLDAEKIPARLTGGGRLAVLSPSLVDELFARPAEREEGLTDDEEAAECRDAAGTPG